MSKPKKCPFVILGVLAVQSKSSGYDIKKMIETSLSYCWKESFGAIYPALTTLEKEGLVTSVAEGKKRLYSLTQSGQATFQDWMKEPPLEVQPRHELLLKLFFGHTSEPDIIKTHLETNKTRIQEKLKGLKQVQKMLDQHFQKDPGYPYWIMSLDYGVMQLETALKWTQKSLKTIESVF